MREEMIYNPNFYQLTDGLHLSEAGYIRLTQIIKPILQKYITQL